MQKVTIQRHEMEVRKAAIGISGKSDKKSTARRSDPLSLGYDSSDTFGTNGTAKKGPAIKKSKMISKRGIDERRGSDALKSNKKTRQQGRKSLKDSLPFKKPSKVANGRATNIENYKKLKEQRNKEYSMNRKLHDEYRKSQDITGKTEIEKFSQLEKNNTDKLQSDLNAQKMNFRERLKSRREKSISKIKKKKPQVPDERQQALNDLADESLTAKGKVNLMDMLNVNESKPEPVKINSSSHVLQNKEELLKGVFDDKSMSSGVSCDEKVLQITNEIIPDQVNVPNLYSVEDIDNVEHVDEIDEINKVEEINEVCIGIKGLNNLNEIDGIDNNKLDTAMDIDREDSLEQVESAHLENDDLVAEDLVQKDLNTVMQVEVESKESNKVEEEEVDVPLLNKYFVESEEVPVQISSEIKADQKVIDDLIEQNIESLSEQRIIKLNSDELENNIPILKSVSGSSNINEDIILTKELEVFENESPKVEEVKKTSRSKKKMPSRKQSESKSKKKILKKKSKKDLKKRVVSKKNIKAKPNPGLSQSQKQTMPVTESKKKKNPLKKLKGRTGRGSIRSINVSGTKPKANYSYMSKLDKVNKDKVNKNKTVEKLKLSTMIKVKATKNSPGAKTKNDLVKSCINDKGPKGVNANGKVTFINL